MVVSGSLFESHSAMGEGQRPGGVRGHLEHCSDLFCGKAVCRGFCFET